MDSNGESSIGAASLSTFTKKGDRQLFKVELRPDETVIVSWKKLIKDANRVNGSAGNSVNPPAEPRCARLESPLAPGQPADLDKDAPPAHRFSAVIEKIERLYTGENSSDGKDLNDIPDDDQYDTEDSFIDDAELDEYFEVDNSAIKHDGFFVNRGKLERIEPSVQTDQQPKKRRRKDMGKSQGEGDNGCASTKNLKAGRAAAGKATGLLRKNLHAPSQSSVVAVKLPEHSDISNQLKTPDTASRKNVVNAKTILGPCSSSKVLDAGTFSVSLVELKSLDKNSPSKDHGYKSKARAGDSSTLHQKYSGKSISGFQVNTITEQKISGLPGQKNGNSERCSKPMKNKTVQKKDASIVRPKISMLERATRELEKMVAESRPPVVDNQDADAVKRRLPREIKQKLAKVARLAQASHGKISDELLNRLMSILGHLIQLRTLKRNLQVMISTGLSAKQEKDTKFQHIKKELAEMIRVQVSLLEAKALEPQAGESDNFQDVGNQDKGVQRNFSIDAALEDKICDLYDLFIDGLDEDAGPQLRKLYAELANLWPSSLMDNHGIKRAIFRAKERRRERKHKEQDALKRKKILATKVDQSVQTEGGSVAQSHNVLERLNIDAVNQGVCSVPGDGTIVLAINATKPVTSTTAVKVSNSTTDGASLDRLKQEMSKDASGNAVGDVRVSMIHKREK